MASRKSSNSKKKSPSKSPPETKKSSRLSMWTSNRVTMFVLIVLSWIIGLVILFSFGLIGVFLKETLELFLGSFGLVLIIGIMAAGLFYLWKMGAYELPMRVRIGLCFFAIFWLLTAGLSATAPDNPSSSLMVLITSLTDFSTMSFHSGCGLLGGLLAWLFTLLFSKTGALVFDVAFLFLAIVLIGWPWWKHFLTRRAPRLPSKSGSKNQPVNEPVNPFRRPTLFGRLKAWANEGLEEDPDEANVIEETPKQKKRPPRLPYGRLEEPEEIEDGLGGSDSLEAGDPYDPEVFVEDGYVDDTTDADPYEDLRNDGFDPSYETVEQPLFRPVRKKESLLSKFRKRFGKPAQLETDEAQPEEVYVPNSLLQAPSKGAFEFALEEDALDDNKNPTQQAISLSSANSRSAQSSASSASSTASASRRRAAPSRHAPFGVAADTAGVMATAAKTAASRLGETALDSASRQADAHAAALESTAALSLAAAGVLSSSAQAKQQAAQESVQPEPKTKRSAKTADPSAASASSSALSSSSSSLPAASTKSSPASASKGSPKQLTIFDADPTAQEGTKDDYASYRLPPMSLLQEPRGARRSSAINARKAKEQGEHLISILEQFGVDAALGEIHIGPSVTEFEVIPGQGVRVNAFVNLQSDIKLALAAKDIRVEAPIPGKSAVGIEVPNEEKTTVCMKELISRVPEKYAGQPLVFTLGKDLMGENIYGRLDTMPHLLIAGATGSGKSVCVNSVICSLLLRTRPDEVKLLLVDPKKVEFTPYNGIPHLLAPVITDAAMASGALKLIVDLMDERYSRFETLRVRNLAGYNEYVRKHPGEDFEVMPRIVVIIDELADLMLAASKDVEASIQRITQLARAAGIHLIVATQRPSVNVITGVIKANIPSRIAFMVSSRPDSRTILDQSGAEKLLGYGDMLFLDNGAASPKRIQGVFIQDQEVEAICEFVRKQGEPHYDPTFLALKETKNISADEDPFEEDPLYNEVRHFVIVSRKASTSLIQRRFRIGYGRAARILDQLEANRIIGPAQGTRPRAVLIDNNEEDEGEF